MSEDVLIDLCEPYLLDLIGFIAECMRREEDNPLAVAEDSGYGNLPISIITRIDSLSYLEKAEVLATAANHIKAIAERERTRIRAEESNVNS